MRQATPSLLSMHIHQVVLKHQRPCSMRYVSWTNTFPSHQKLPLKYRLVFPCCQGNRYGAILFKRTRLVIHRRALCLFFFYLFFLTHCYFIHHGLPFLPFSPLFFLNSAALANVRTVMFCKGRKAALLTVRFIENLSLETA